MTRLARGRAPYIEADVRSRVGPAPEGKVSRWAYGEETASEGVDGRVPAHDEPATTRAVIASVLFSNSEIARRAGVGREALRRCLYGNGTQPLGEETERKIADALGLSGRERASVEAELTGPPADATKHSWALSRTSLKNNL